MDVIVALEREDQLRYASIDQETEQCWAVKDRPDAKSGDTILFLFQNEVWAHARITRFVRIEREMRGIFLDEEEFEPLNGYPSNARWLIFFNARIPGPPAEYYMKPSKAERIAWKEE